MVNKSKNATFTQRLIAYLIDIVLVSFVVSVIALPFVDNESINKLNDDAKNIASKYLAKEIDTKAYFNEYSSLSYQMDRQEGVVVLITIFVSIMYFVVYQFYKSGQTIGKKIMKIKIVSDVDNLSINTLVIRSVIINSILYQILHVALVSALDNSMDYTSIKFALESLQNMVVLISALMILYSKNKKGIHDIVSKTSVVNV